MLSSSRNIAICSFIGVVTAANISRSAPTSTVPPGWTRVPSGVAVRPDCIHVVPNNSVVDLESGTVTLNGSKIAQHSACPEQPVRPKGNAAAQQGTPPGNYYGWVEAAQEQLNLSNPNNISHLSAWWNVPPAPVPPSGDNPIIYIWPGIQSDQCLHPNFGCEVLQPVLAWGSAYICPTGGSCAWYGGNYWWIASWAVGDYGTWLSQPQQVSVGDWLIGSVITTSYNSQTDQTAYAILAQDIINNNNSGFSIVSAGITWDWAFAGVLEVWQINQCSDFPPSQYWSGEPTYSEFEHIFLETNYPNNNIATGTWSAWYPIFYNGPDCGFTPYAFSNNSGSYWNDLTWMHP